MPSALGDDRRWDRAKGSLSHTYNQSKLGELARELIGPLPEPGHLLLVTDVEIEPPNGWRYIVWDDCPGGSVVSTAPTDPEYWSIRDPLRSMTFKQRVRSACCSALGVLMGLGRCGNPDCFLYSQVDSVRVLDRMIYFGGEHRARGLTRRGFTTKADAPAAVQDVVQYRTSRSHGA